ncbi:MAG TPA: hypothetical protein PLA39_02960 [Methanoculleus sp.]|jgi:hypothetical protein|nr:hypothetical protein [Methanoculleus sp.]
MCRRPEMGYPYGTVDGGRSRIGAGLAEAVLILPTKKRAGRLLAIPRRDVVLFFGVVGRRTPVYDGAGTEVGYGVWEGDLFRVYVGEAPPLEIPARDLRGAVRELPKAGTVYRGAA